jgi:hypothetical protein
MTQKKLFQALVDFGLETFSAIHDPSVDMVAFSLEHPAVGAVDGLWQQQKRLRNRHEGLALFSSLHDAFGLALSDGSVFASNHSHSLFPLPWWLGLLFKLLLQA